VPSLVEVARSNDVVLSRSTCDGGPAGPEVVEGWEVVCVRSGVFRRETEEGVALVDPTTIYLGRPGQSHLIHHVEGRGDAADVVLVSSALVEPFGGRIPALPFDPGPAALLAARALVSAARRGADDTALDEAVVDLLGLLVADRQQLMRARGTGPRRTTVERVLERLSCEVETGVPPASLASLAADAGYSPHHLSRAFRAVTGTTISRHRRALRVRAALAHIEDGANDLSAVAAEVGFCDHSHLVRAMRAELGSTPTGLRRLLATATA
jgi:AraC-like DNA-binding protein